MPDTSPIPTKKKSPKTIAFPEALQAIIDGKRVTKLEWQNNESFGLLKDGYLMLHLAGEYKTWIINDGDLLGDDWVVLTDAN